MDKVTCPYCDKECDIDHGDGAFYEEDKLEEMECEHCDKIFLVTTSIIYHHTGDVCPCKNGEEHKWKQIQGCPMEILEGKERCEYCDEERDTYTPEKRQETHNKYIKKLDKLREERNK